MGRACAPIGQPQHHPFILLPTLLCALLLPGNFFPNARISPWECTTLLSGAAMSSQLGPALVRPLLAAGELAVRKGADEQPLNKACYYDADEAR